MEGAHHSSEDRVLAAICHASILVPTYGIAIPVVIWATQKDKSEFLRFQALQAAAYHLLWMALSMVIAMLYLLSFVGMFVPMLFAPLVTDDVAAILVLIGFMMPFIGMALMALFSVGGIGYGLVAALLTGLGRPFHYPLLGSWLERALEDNRAAASA